MRVLYADFSPGYAWDGRDPEALEAATTTQATPRTVNAFDATVVAALDALPRRLAVLVGGTTPAHAPATVTFSGLVDGVSDSEVVTLPTSAAGARVRGAVSTRKAFAGTDLSITFAAGSGTGGTTSLGLGLAAKVADLRVVVPIATWLEGFGDRPLTYSHLDVNVIDEIVVGASGKIDGALGTPNGNYDVPFPLVHLGDVARITRDFALAEAGKLRPNTMQVDYVALRRDAEKDLEKLRKALAGVGEAPPDPAKNVGGNVGAIGDNPPVTPPEGFFDNMGDYA